MDNLPARKDVDPKYTWNLASIFPTLDDWERSFREVEQACLELKRFQGKLGESPQVLADWLETAAALRQKTMMTLMYARLNYAVDSTDQASAALNSRASGLMARAASAAAFEEPELMAVGFEKLRGWLKEEPRLADFAHYFDKLEKRAAHVRSTEVEELLSQLIDPFQTASATHGILANADMTFKPARASGSPKPVEVTHSKMRLLLGSPDRKLRRSAWQSYADGHLAFKNTQANCIAAGYKQDALLARVRGYKSSVEAALEGNYIPVQVFFNVIDAFKANLPVWHRYWDLRRRVLKLRKTGVYDTYATLTPSDGAQSAGAARFEISYEQAVDWISTGLKLLGDDYVAILRKGALEDGWVDSVMNKGKRFGAFSSGMKGTNPFIMMSYDRSIFSMSTLAHELGHSMHSYFTTHTQPFINSRYGLFAAEVASNFHQAMTRDYLLRANPQPEFQAAVLLEAMSNFYRYFFTMPVLAMFDLEVHQRVERGSALTADILNGIMADLLEAGYGPNMLVDRARDGCLWMQFSTHLYSNFYAYQYTTGIAGAHSLAAKVLTGDPAARDAYRAFLCTGDSLYPADSLKLAGVDLTTPEPINRTFQVLSGYIDRLEKLLL